MLRHSLFLILIVLCASCRSAPEQPEEGQAETAKFEAPENSGKRLAGEFVWQTAEDDYRKSETRARLVIAFDESGSFKRKPENVIGEDAQEEGGYIISKGDELVLFIEKTGGGQLESAKVERYSIKEQSDSRLVVQADRAGSFILEKRK